MMTIQELAGQLTNALETAKRGNGAVFFRLAEDSPEWMTDAIRAAHNDAQMLPDDWRYRFIKEISTLIENEEFPADVVIEPDIYTSDLTAWLNSRSDRVEYLKDALDNFGTPDSGYQLLAWAQYREKKETHYQLLTFFENMVGEEE